MGWDGRMYILWFGVLVRSIFSGVPMALIDMIIKT